MYYLEEYLLEAELEPLPKKVVRDGSAVSSSAEDKIRHSAQMDDGVGRYLKMLNQQLTKVSMDLETDQPGSTGLLQKRFKFKRTVGGTECDEASRKNRVASRVGMSSHEASSRRGGCDDGNATATTSSGGPPSGCIMTRSRKCKEQEVVAQQHTVVQIKEEPTIPMNMNRYNLRPRRTVYCICKDVEHGEMVACDSPGCLIEWFHYCCVEVTSAPTGQWYCPTCSVQRKIK